MPEQMALASGPTSDETRAICALIAGDPVHDHDRHLIVDAILADAAEHGGVVDPNRVRASLSTEAITIAGTRTTTLTVSPRLMGPTYMALAHAGVITASGWTTSTDTAGRNSGKPCRRYRLNPDRLGGDR